MSGFQSLFREGGWNSTPFRGSVRRHFGQMRNAMPGLDAALTILRSAWSGLRGWIARFRTDIALRERMFARAVFAAIFASGAFAFDQIVTGGADWSIGASQAYAMTPAAAPVSLPRQRATTVAFAEDEQPVEPIVEIDYSFTTETLLGGPDDPAAPNGYHAKHLGAAHNETTMIAPLKSNAS